MKLLKRRNMLPERAAARVGRPAACVCVLTGALGAGCFYLPQIAFLLWLIPAAALLLLFAEGECRGRASRRRSVKLAALFTFSFFLCSYLVGFTIDVYFSRPIMLLLDAALILVASLVQAVPQIIALCVGSRLRLPAAIRACAVAVLWAAAEWLTTVGPFAFPVRHFSVSQWFFPALLNMSSLFGELFISFVMILFASFLALSLKALGLFQLKTSAALTAASAKAPPVIYSDSVDFDIAAKLRYEEQAAARDSAGAAFHKREALVFLITAFVVFFANITIGAFVTRGFAEAPQVTRTNYAVIAESLPGQNPVIRHLRIAALQHNQPITDDDSVRFANALSQARAVMASDNTIDVLALPESTAQFVRGNEGMQAELSALARASSVDIIIGGVNRVTGGQSATADNGEGSGLVKLSKDKDGGARFENAVHHITRDGDVSGYYYAKQQLVPFFENGSIQKFSFFSGDERGVFETAKGRIGAVVCFESVLGETVRDTVRAGAEVILVPSNDAYLGEEIRTMHIAQSVLRAIETNRVILQVATNGVTAAAYPDGGLITLPMNKEDVLIADAPLSDSTTLYVRFGDLWLIIALGLLALLVFIARVIRRQTSPSPSAAPLP